MKMDNEKNINDVICKTISNKTYIMFAHILLYLICNIIHTTGKQKGTEASLISCNIFYICQVHVLLNAHIFIVFRLQAMRYIIGSVLKG